jgi:two-component system, NarL family, nitrate/nitrite response regulator NarL
MIVIVENYDEIRGAAMNYHDVNIAILSSNTLFREGMAKILKSEGYNIICTKSTLEGSDLPAIADHGNVVLIVRADDDFASRLALVKHFKGHCPLSKIIMLNEHFRIDEARVAYEAGVSSYVVHVATCDGFLKMLELVLMGETVLPPEMLQALMTAPDSVSPAPVSAPENNAAEAASQPRASNRLHLSAQERQVLSYLVEGHSNKVIARKVQTAEATVKVHVKAILRKINVVNRTQAAVWAMSNLPTQQASTAGADWQTVENGYGLGGTAGRNDY